MALDLLMLLRFLIHSGGIQLAASAVAAAAATAASVAVPRAGLGRFAVGLHFACYLAGL